MSVIWIFVVIWSVRYVNVFVGFVSIVCEILSVSWILSVRGGGIFWNLRNCDIGSEICG